MPQLSQIFNLINFKGLLVPKTLHNTSRQKPEYYSEVLRILIGCSANAMTYAATAEVLNSQQITTPTSLTWQEQHIRQLLKKLRNYRTYPSFIAQHLMQEVFEGSISTHDAALLFKSRKPSVAL